MSERSQSPSRITKILSKTRVRDKKSRDSATNSLRSEASDGLGGRASLDSAIDKLREGAGSDDEEHPGGIKKLVPKGLVSKRKRRKQEEESRASEEAEAARGRSVAERGTLRNDSGSSLNNGTPDGNSLLSYDSEIET